MPVCARSTAAHATPAANGYSGDAGLPVWPVAAHGERFLVLVGAAPQSKELETTLRRLTGLRSWDETLAYADAYVERIDRLIER